jgi:hypothetical protein
MITVGDQAQLITYPHYERRRRRDMSATPRDVRPLLAAS